MLAEDIRCANFLKRKLAHASVGRVLIERPAKDARSPSSRHDGRGDRQEGRGARSAKGRTAPAMGVTRCHVNIEEIRSPRWTRS